jgi:long-chain acyl-CoA synthetase
VEKPWLDSYPEGVPAEIDFAAYNSILDLFDRSREKYRDQTAYINFGRELTYGELDRRSRDFAAWLQSKGMRKGDRIALMMPNILQYPVAVFGAMRAGMVIVNTNPMYTPRELRHQLQDSGARAIVVA